MTKLKDTQLIVLSSAAKHDDGLATRPASLNTAAAMKVASSLADKGLAREIRAKPDAPVWHENDDGRFALKITRAGREAIGVDDDEAQDDASASAAPAQGMPKKRGSKPAAKSTELDQSQPVRTSAYRPLSLRSQSTSPRRFAARGFFLRV